VAAEAPGAGAEVDDVIGGADRLLVVLDDEHRVAEIAQALEGAERRSLSRACRPIDWLVEHVHHARELAAELAREADALGLAARERRRGAVERQVVEADVEEEAEARVDLAEHTLGDRRLALGQRELLEEGARVADRERGDVGDALARHLHRERLGAHAAALTGIAGHVAEVLRVLLAHLLRGRLLVAAHERGDHAVELDGPAAVVLRALLAPLHTHLAALEAVQDLVLLLGRELLPRHVEVDASGLGHRLDDAEGPALAALDARGPRLDRAAADRERGVGHDQIGIDLEHGAETVALGAHAERAVEREALRRERGVADAAALSRLAEVDAAARVGLGLDADLALAGLEAELDGLGEASAIAPGERHPVDDDLEIVLLLAGEEHAEVVVDLGDGADGGAGVFADGLLFDADGG
jgi:hypothetical protein